MTQYLIKHTTHITGETFTDVTKIRDNETYQVVEAESKEEAEEMAKKPIITETNNSTVVSFERPSEETMESLFGKDYKKGQ
ncbi:DUF1381 domain-containing protein [Staphylococcus edaphicus]|uniref:DUF1381 domain-containing protein n=1 Tax=Staphylococcus edaphicus TaxID=1955013 RepID=A0A2C6WJ22_9STAP|nr:DUF1381 domain-containing protein [Staphylococcus edaphicus]PHK50778.1 DUF1381 domain-containing protein [Staphylococcus edaphicus]UQW82472.1 DUF1381 domain-containing protein [Staphylococcus edaphicus]